MTSLAKQLKRLEVPATGGGVAENLRTSRASFLFDRKTQLDRETVFAIGLNGLEELEILQPDFIRYRETLFDESSIRLERSVESNQTNAKLDIEITSFFRLMSPFMLLKPAHKALEWLVHRFNVHLYNSEQLIDCVLPFHDTVVFVRVIQLLDVDRLPRWRFLQQCQDTGSPLSKLAVINRCESDLDFLRHICQLVEDSVKVDALRTRGHLRTLVNFYLSTVLGVLEREIVVYDPLLTTLLPYLMHSVQSTVPEYVGASYAVIAQIALKVKAIEDVWMPLLDAIFKKTPVNLQKEAISCAAVICKTQTLTRLPVVCRKRVMGTRMRTVMADLSDQVVLSSFTQLVIRHQMLNALKAKGLKKISDANRAMSRVSFDNFEWLIHNVRVTDEDVSQLIRVLMTSYIRLVKKGIGHKRSAIRILKLFEKKYSDDFDELLSGHCSSYFKNKKSGEVVNLLVRTFQTTPKTDWNSANLFLGFNHPSAVRRKLAIQQLAKSESLDAEACATFIIDRLADDDPEVVATVLHLNKLISCVPEELLAKSLLSIFNKCQTQPTWKMNKMSCATIMSRLDETLLSAETHARIIAHLLPILLNRYVPTIPSELLLGGTLPLFTATLTALEDSDVESRDQVSKFSLLLSAISRALAGAHSLPFKKSLVKCLLSEAKQYQQDTFFVKVILPLVFCEWLLNESDVEFRLEFSQSLLVFIADCLRKKEIFKFTAQLSATDAAAILQSVKIDCNFVQFLSENGPGIVLLVSFSKLITIMQLPSNAHESLWFDLSMSSTDLTSLLSANATIFLILSDMGCSPISRLLLKQWKNTNFANYKEGMIRFLLFLATSPGCCSNGSSVACQLRSLHTINALIVDGYCSNETVNPLVAALLAASASTSSAVRSIALSSLSAFSIKLAAGDTFVGLLKALDGRQAEIREDGSLLQVVLATYFAGGMFGEPRNDLSELLRWIVDQRTPDHIQDKLLFCVADVDDPDILLELVPTLDAILESRDINWLTDARHSVAQRIIRQFKSENVGTVLLKSPAAFRVFIKALRSSDSLVTSRISLQMTILSQISKHMFAAIESDELQQEIVRNLIDLQVDNEDYVAAKKMTKVLRKAISSNTLMIRRELERAIPITTALLLKEVNSTNQKNDTAMSDDFIHKRTVILLEGLHGKLASAIGQDHRVVPVLFAHLKRYLDRRDPMTSEYGKQLILSALNDALQWKEEDGQITSGLGPDQFNIELVIDCIRTSSSPKTHQGALLLLALAAKRFPEHVVHNTMAIFTFMGENVIRKDDCSSFDVILRTVEAIVPAVVQRDDMDVEEEESLQTACALTRVFVDAVPDIPEHRRLPLFSCLVSALGESRFLWFTVALVLERLITHKKNIASTAEKTSFSRLRVLEFGVQLSHHYSPSCQIAACESLIDVIIQLPDLPNDKDCDSKHVSEKKSYFDEILDMERHSPRLRCQFKLMVAEFVSTLLTSRQFLNQVVDLRSEKQERMMLMYQKLLKKVLNAAHAVASRLARLKSDDLTLIKYFKVLQHRVYELLDKLSSLLPSNLFVDVIDQLMKDGQLLVRHKALEILATKLQHRLENLDKPNRASLKRVVPTLLSIVQSTAVNEETHDVKLSDMKIIGTEASNRQLALLTLKCLCRQLGGDEPHLFRRVLEAATTVVSEPNVDDNVRAAALLYVAEHCHSVRTDAIAHLSAFVPALLTVLDGHRMDVIQKHELLLISVVSTLHKVIERLAAFLSPYIAEILEKVCYLSILEPVNPKSPLVDRLTTIRSNLAILVPPRVLIPAIKLCFETFCKSEDGKVIGPLMGILREYVANSNKEQLVLWHSTLFAFYLVALDYRSEHNLKSSEEDDTYVSNVNVVEGFIIEPIMATILKMSEATFRPFFIKLFDWAVRGDGFSDRVITFYRIADRVADQLKSLFVLFAGHLIKNAAVMLDKNNLSKTEEPFFIGERGAKKSGALVRYILGCLHKCFLYDNEGFMTKERFETLIQPVVDQLENVDVTDECEGDDYESLIVDCVAPCIARMAVATVNDALWKPLNYQVLLKTRHQLPKVRYGALHVLRELTKCIGEDYVTLLPETIPFLAELMEDEKLEVEQQCQSVIADMEVALGEPLQKYF